MTEILMCKKLYKQLHGTKLIDSSWVQLPRVPQYYLETYTVHKSVQLSEGGCCSSIIYQDCNALFGFAVFTDNLM